jgi:hypothetical protein
MPVMHIEWAPRIASSRAGATSASLLGDIELLLALLGDGRSCAEAVGDLAGRRNGVAPNLAWSENCRLQPFGSYRSFAHPSSWA